MKFTFESDIKPFTISGNTSLKRIYYDATCNLCIHSLQLIRKFDRGNIFEFIPLQYSGEHKITQNQVCFQSIILKENNQIYQKSDAVLRIVKYLKWPVSWLYVFIAVPKAWRDRIYDFIAGNRYKWFGRNDTCGVL